MGADEVEQIEAVSVDANHREKITSDSQYIDAWTKFTFPNRHDKYSDYHWSWKDFDGIDYDEKTKRNRIFRFTGKDWDTLVDDEHENYDYLMGADIDFEQPDVVQELTRWGAWFLSEADHFAMSLFDVPLHYHFYEASSSNGQYDMSKLLEDTLVSYDEFKTITFVDNHDTQPSAYAIILLRKQGYPCVFMGIIMKLHTIKLRPKTQRLTVYYSYEKHMHMVSNMTTLIILVSSALHVQEISNIQMG